MAASESPGEGALPRPPRTVRTAAAFATWSGFGALTVLALALALATALALLAADGFRLPRFDWRLDAAPATHRTMAELTRPPPPGGGRCAYTFVADGTEHAGSSWAPAPVAALLQEGNRCTVEFLGGDPQVNRLVGTHRARAAIWLPQFAGWALLPAVLAVAVWLARVQRTWVILRHGQAAPARLLERSAVRVPPGHWRVRYGFREADGSEREASQYVRRSGPLGAAIGAAAVGQPLAGALAIHGDDPRRSRLVAGRDVGEAAA